MKLAVIFLNQTELLEDLLSAFLEIGISGATVIDSVGMGHIISEHIPIFAGLRDAFAGSSPANKIILSVIDESQLETVAELVRDMGQSYAEKGAALMISLPVDKVFNFHND